MVLSLALLSHLVEQSSALPTMNSFLVAQSPSASSLRLPLSLPERAGLMSGSLPGSAGCCSLMYQGTVVQLLKASTTEMSC